MPAELVQRHTLSAQELGVNVAEVVRRAVSSLSWNHRVGTLAHPGAVSGRLNRTLSMPLFTAEVREAAQARFKAAASPPWRPLLFHPGDDRPGVRRRPLRDPIPSSDGASDGKGRPRKYLGAAGFEPATPAV